MTSSASLRLPALAVLAGLALPQLGCPAAQVKRPPPPPPPSLEGAWQSDCLPIQNADETDGSARLVYGVTSTLWALDLQLFGDDVCGVATATIHTDGGWQLEQPSSVIPGAWDIRFDVRTRTVTPHVEGFVAYLQSLSCEGIAGVDRAADVLDVGCPALGLLPYAACQAEFDVVAADASSLRFGARAYDRDRCSAQARPPTLGTPLHRIQ